ncbi:MAG: sulfatase family protein [Actinomycetota bacterium]
MDRKKRWAATAAFLAASTLAASAGIAFVASRRTLDQPTRDRRSAPNVLIIVTDDQRTDTLDVMPALRRWFMDGGVHFTRGYVTTPLCCPSRASIFTGRYAHNHGVKKNHVTKQFDFDSTIQHRLRSAGYNTAIVGKYFNDWTLARNPADFDRWAVAGGRYRGVRANLDGSIKNVEKYSTAFVEEYAVRFLRDFEQQDSTPWLLYVAPNAPHPPFTPEARYSDAPVPAWHPAPNIEEPDVTDKPEFVSELRGGPRFPSELESEDPTETGRQVRALQLRTLMSVDDLVTAIFTELRRSGEISNTLAFFVSDNGYLWGEHGAIGKRLPYRESVRVPFFVRYPGRLPEGATDDRLVANIDIAPTIVDAAGLEADEDSAFDGMSLLQEKRRRHLYIEEFGSRVKQRPRWRGIIADRYRFTVYSALGPGEGRFLEYYRLDRDPYELRNVLAGGDRSNDLGAPRIARLMTLLRRYARCSGEQCP